MNLAVAATVFPIIFLGELPDKTMFASLVLASRGRPLAVWVGATLAFLVHVVIAVTVGVALFHLLPRRAVDAVVAAAFLAGAVYSWLIRNRNDDEVVDRDERTRLQAVATAAIVVFVAEWGDLTQILTANLAARYHDTLAVAVGALVALAAVAGLAVVSGAGLLRVVSVRTLRMATAVVLVGLAAWSLTLVI